MTPAPYPSDHKNVEFPKQRIFSDYYPSWKAYNGRKPSDLRLDLFTHVNYAFANVAKDGSIYHRDTKADTQLLVEGTHGALPSLVKLRDERHPHLRIVLSIGSGSGSSHFADVAADVTKSMRFCETARDMVVNFRLDGIDIDWEHPSNAAQGRSFSSLIVALRKYLSLPKYTITAALPVGEWCLRHIDLPGLLNGPSAPLDHINLMTYDFSGSWTNGQSGHHACLYASKTPHNDFAKRSIAGAVQYLTEARKVESSKVVIGIPVYGRAFGGVQGPGEKFTRCTGHSGTYEYRGLPLHGSKELVDKDLVAASCYRRNSNGEHEWVSYDSPRTVSAKGQFVVERGLGGIFFWTSASDVDSSDRSLVVAAHSALSSTATQRPRPEDY